jgi:hypothetical protein
MTLAAPPKPRVIQRQRRVALLALLFLVHSLVWVDSIQIPTYSEEAEVESPQVLDTHYGVQHPQINQDDKPPDSYEEFMTWCTQVLGIQTSLEIRDFEYHDFMRIRMQYYDDDDECDQEHVPQQEYEDSVITVRGLSATSDIQIGDVVISIPFHALLTIPTTIDHDPVLSAILGPAARAKYGWQDSYFETPLLTICILYHKHLDMQSPLHHYIQLLQSNSPQDDMPLLWSTKKLRREATSGVRRIVRAIQSDVKEMYDTVMVPLKQEHPTIFDKEDYSIEQFQWAFAMVNSRHWYLPIPDLNPQHVNSEETEYGGYHEQVLPASQPTEEWVREQGEQESDDGVSQQDIRGVNSRDSHSFMAPVGDMLNFGPPCTRGSYNEDKKTFELIATCPFLAGQEVTFWYADDCEDVIIANYGFTHPMVPQCPSAEDWREKSELWKRRAESLELQLEESYKELGKMDVELEDLRLMLRKCECDSVTPEPRPAKVVEEKRPDEGPTKLRRFVRSLEPIETADGLRGVRDDVVQENNSHARHGVRRQWHRHGSMSGSSL